MKAYRDVANFATVVSNYEVVATFTLELLLELPELI